MQQCSHTVEILVSSTRVLPLPLPMAQLGWQERIGGVFLCGDCDVRFGVSINFPPLYGSASSVGTKPPRLPYWWAHLERVLSAMLPPVVDTTEIFDGLTEWKYILSPSCF